MRRTAVGEAFVDSNVLLYLISSDAAKADRAAAILKTGPTISVQVLNEFANVCVRRKALRVPEVREILAVLRLASTVVDVTLGVHEAGLALHERYGFSIYDAMIVAAAAEAGCTALYSEDLEHGQRVGGLTIRNPFRT
jgi:predicted nucleic acid-binding protein